MDSEHIFARDEVLPSWWANVVSRYLSTYASGFSVVKQDATHIQIPASAGAGAAVLSIQGRWRYVEANVSRAHPGGAAATYDIFVTAKETQIDAVPAAYTDNTDYSFALAIVAHGATPPIVAGTVDVFRKVGELVWDGAAITRVDQLVPYVHLHAHTHATGQSDPIAPADIGAAPETELAAEIVRAEAAEAANAAAITAETARAEAAEAGMNPIGATIAFTGSGDLGGGQYVVADGRLIDKTTYATFFARTGHKYNGGVDPGSNKVRIPDKRGRKSLGAIDMGTGAPTIDNSRANVAAGAKGGEVNHTTTEAEMPSHQHGGATGGMSANNPHRHTQNGNLGDSVAPGGSIVYTIRANALGGPIAPVDYTDIAHTHVVNADGSSSPHNNLDPYEADVYLVRIA